jgi:hypothetical protein
MLLPGCWMGTVCIRDWGALVALEVTPYRRTKRTAGSCSCEIQELGTSKIHHALLVVLNEYTPSNEDTIYSFSCH